MSKTICVLTYPRTGSNWLCNTLAGPNTYCAYEIFCADPLAFYSKMLFLMKSVYKMDKVIVDTFSKIFSPNNFYLTPQLKKEIQKSTLEAHGSYSVELLQTLKQKAYDINRNFIFKIFPEHLELNNLDLNEVLNTADYVVLNYRNSLLDSFISLRKALLSERWDSHSRNNYLEQIHWDKNEYQAYANHISSTFNRLKAACDRTSAIVIDLCYEEIHHSNLSQEEKVDLVTRKFLKAAPSFNWPFNKTLYSQKENYIQRVEDNFSNPETFLNEQSQFRTSLTTT